jgi:hypothetical protein
MLPRTRHVFIGWTLAAVIILCSQIVALLIPAPTPGGHTVVLIGPTPAVLAAIGANLLILCLLITMGGKTNATVPETSYRIGGPVRQAATGFLGSFLTIFAITILVNLLVNFSN